MAAVMTWDSLVRDLINYPQRTTDAVYQAQIPSIISLGEQTLITELKIRGDEKYVTSAFQIDRAVYDKPARWKETISISFGTGSGFNTINPLLERSYEYASMYWPNRAVSNVLNPPEYYSDYGFNHWLISPTPPVAYPFEVAFYELWQPLDATHQTNWLTANAPDLLLYSCLNQAIPFLRDNPQIPIWQAYYKNGKQSYIEENASRVTDRTGTLEGKV